MDGQSARGRFYWPGVPDHPLHPYQYTFPQYHQEQYLLPGGGKVNLAVAIDPSGSVLARAAAKLANWEQHKLAVQCKLCRDKGHYQKDCPELYHRCSVSCTVRTNHPNFAPRTCRLRCRRGIRMSRKQQFLEDADRAESFRLRNDNMDVI